MGSGADVDHMTTAPSPSPWPAPSLADLVLADTASSAQHGRMATAPRRPVAALLGTAKRMSSRTERAVHAAAKQERRISDELNGLPAGWYVLGPVDLDADARRVDHTAIGPGGIFAIYLEHQLGAKVWVSEHAVTINGQDSDHLRQVRFEARRASGRLTDACGFDVTVQSVLLLIGAATLQTLSRPAEVHVRTQDDFRDWLCRQPTRLDADSVRAIYEQLRPVEAPPARSTVGLIE